MELGRKAKMSRIGYAQFLLSFLLSSQTNYTLTYFAEHVAEVSHDAINRYWAVDYRLYAPEQDGKGKLEHVEDMLKSAIYSKN